MPCLAAPCTQPKGWSARNFRSNDSSTLGVGLGPQFPEHGPSLLEGGPNLVEVRSNSAEISPNPAQFWPKSAQIRPNVARLWSNSCKPHRRGWAELSSSLTELGCQQPSERLGIGRALAMFVEIGVNLFELASDLVDISPNLVDTQLTGSALPHVCSALCRLTSAITVRPILGCCLR